jgi:hypothetical protein
LARLGVTLEGGKEGVWKVLEYGVWSSGGTIGGWLVGWCERFVDGEMRIWWLGGGWGWGSCGERLECIVRQFIELRNEYVGMGEGWV